MISAGIRVFGKTAKPTRISNRIKPNEETSTFSVLLFYSNSSGAA
jgi:hypothetical protein